MRRSTQHPILVNPRSPLNSAPGRRRASQLLRVSPRGKKSFVTFVIFV
jgi:hypothetical protein